MKVPFVDLKTQYQSIKSEVDPAIAGIIENTAFIGGPVVANFEKNFASYCGADYCLGVANGTDALHIALRVLGVGAGDEVITAANTFIATTEGITLAGASVKLVDINPETCNIDVNLVESAITPNTKAIIAVHLYGQPADMDALKAIAKKHNIFLIEDAAQAHGSDYKGTRPGALGDIACFSFYPGKNLGAYGDGGAIVSNNADWIQKARTYANHGRGSSKYDHVVEGTNSRLDGIQAAVLDIKLKYLDGWNQSRQKNAKLYEEKLADVAGVKTLKILDGCTSVYHLYVIEVQDREGLLAYLKENGIGAGVHYGSALNLQPAYAHLNQGPGSFPLAEKKCAQICSLPMFPELSEEQIDYVVGKVKEFVG